MKKIVIDIDDEDYKRIQDIPDVFNSLTSRIYSAIKNGAPLPNDDVRAFDAAIKKLRKNVLTKKESTILYHFKEKSQTVKEIAEEFNMTEYGIEQILKSAKEKLEANEETGLLTAEERAEFLNDLTEMLINKNYNLMVGGYDDTSGVLFEILLQKYNDEEGLKFEKKKPPKFNKEKCLKCIYRGVKESSTLGAPVTITNEDGEERVAHVYCNYASITGSTCIRLTKDHRDTMDIRGKGPKCKLFAEGESLSRDIKPM